MMCLGEEGELELKLVDHKYVDCKRRVDYIFAYIRM